MFLKTFFRCGITELHQPITAKFCTMTGWIFFFYNAGLRFWRARPQKKFRGQKHAKVDTISNKFKLQWGISLERMKIFKIGQVL